MVRAFEKRKICPKCERSGIAYKLQKGRKWYYYVYHGKTEDGRSIMCSPLPWQKVFGFQLQLLLLFLLLLLAFTAAQPPYCLISPYSAQPP